MVGSKNCCVMKKIFYSILAVAAIVASCAKEAIVETANPSGNTSGNTSALFTGTIIQPNGLDGTKVSIIEENQNNVYINWTAGDQIWIKNTSGKDGWNSEDNLRKFSAVSDGATTEFNINDQRGLSGWFTESYAARFYGAGDAWKEYVLACDAATPDSPVLNRDVNCKVQDDAYIPVKLENMPLNCDASTRSGINNTFKFSSEYAILQINVPTKLEYNSLYVCVNDQDVAFNQGGGIEEGSSYTLRVLNTAQLQAEQGKNYVKIYVPIKADNYDKLTLVATSGTRGTDEAEVARMATYEYNGKKGEGNASVTVDPNTIYYFDFCNTKTIETAGEVTLASNNNIDYKVNIAANLANQLTIKAIDETTAPEKIFINARYCEVNNLVINTPYSHVEIDYGESVSVTSKTSLSTFVVKEHYSIEGLSVTKGSVVVEGKEDKTANVETITIPATADGFINIDVTGVTAGNENVVIDNQSTNGTVQLVKAEESKYEIKEGSKPVVELGGEADVAQIGDKKYFSLAEAIADVKNNETVTLLKNVDQAFGISVPKGSKTFTVDFGGFKYKVEKPGAGSANTKTQAFQLNEGNTITFMNGTIECTTDNKDFTWTSNDQIKGVAMIIQNYANLTLEDMTIDATNIAHNGAATRYAISNNSGIVEFKGATRIISVAGDYAFDVCKYSNYTEPVVTWNSTGTVNGGIELSGGKFVLGHNLNVSRPIRVIAPAELDIASYTLSATSDFSNKPRGVVIVNRGGDLTINGTTGVIDGSSNGVYAAVAMTEPEKCDTDTNKDKAAKLKVIGGTLCGKYYGITGNGTRHNTEITVMGGTIKGTETNNCAGIYHPQNGTLTIGGGTIEGAVGIYVKAGTVTTAVEGGTIKGIGAQSGYQPLTDGFHPTGDAIVFDNCDYPGGAPNADIKGGTFTSTNASAVASYAKEGKEPITAFISGGTFNTQPAGDLIKEGYKIKKNSDTEYTVSVIDANDVATINAFAYSDLATALTALQAGETLKIWKAGEYTVETLSTPANTTVEGMAANRGVVFKHTAVATSWLTNQVDGRTVKNITWNVGTAHHQYLHGVNLVNCKIEGMICTHSNSTYTDCEFYNEDSYNLWEYGTGSTFIGCKFTCPGGPDGKGGVINAYNEGHQAGLKTVILKDCEFIALETSDKYSVMYIKPETDFDVQFVNCTYNDKFCTGDKSGSKLWNVKGHTNLNTKVTVDGKLEYEKGSLVGISTLDQLKAFATAVNGGNKYSGLTVTLYADIDLNNIAWTPIRSNAGGDVKGFTFNGNGHTVSNLNIETDEKAVGFFGNATSAKISNLTIDGATVTGINHVAVLVGNGLCTQIENCTVKNATVESKVKNNDDGDKAAAICGYLSAEPSASIKNCYVENVTVKAYRDLAAIAGYANGNAAPIVSGNTAKDVKVICNQANNYKNYTSNEQYDANKVVGENAASATLDTNTCTNVTVEYVSGSVQQE